MDVTELQIALIRNQRKMALKTFELDLAKACGLVRPRYLPLEESIALYERISAGVVPSHATGRVNRLEMAAMLASAQERFPDQDCLIFLSRYWFMGGLQQRLAIFWNKLLELVHFDGDTVFAVSPCGGQGVMLDLDRSPGEDGGYELFIWGESWPVYAPPLVPAD